MFSSSLESVCVFVWSCHKWQPWRNNDAIDLCRGLNCSPENRSQLVKKEVPLCTLLSPPVLAFVFHVSKHDEGAVTHTHPTPPRELLGIVQVYTCTYKSTWIQNPILHKIKGSVSEYICWGQWMHLILDNHLENIIFRKIFNFSPNKVW